MSDSKPYSVDVSRSTNKEKKLMAVFEDKDGKKVKTTHFGSRGMSDYTKHGDKDRMELYKNRHKKNEHWNRPMTAGSLSKNILWNKPSLTGSFADYKKKFRLKGNLKVSRSADTFESQTTDMLISYVEVVHPDDDYLQEQLMNEITSGRTKISYEDMQNAIQSPSRRRYVNEMMAADWNIDTSWGEPDMEQNNDDWGLEWDSNDIGYKPEMLKAKRMKNRYLPPNMKIEKKEGRKYLFLDFDNTVRHTVPDPQPDEPLRRRPPHKAFEVVMIDGVAEKVRRWQESGYFIVGLTNQSNIESGFNTNQDVIDTIKETLNQLDMQFPVYYASHKNPDLPDYVLRKPRTGMIDAAFRDFGSPTYTYTVMVGDDWEGADSGMAANAGVNFIGVLPFIEISFEDAEHKMYLMQKHGERLELLNPDDLIYTFAEEYSHKMNTHSAESSYSRSTTNGIGIGMFGGKTNMGLLLGIAGGFLLGWNAPSIMSSMKMKKSAESEQGLANQGFMEDWVGGEGGQGDVEEVNAQPPAPLKYDYNPLAMGDATAFDPLTRPPSTF